MYRLQYLGGDIHNDSISMTEASAVCFDAATVTNKERAVGYEEWFTEDLAVSSDTTETACGLTKVGGQYNGSDLASGIRVLFNQRTRTWRWSLYHNKVGGVRCVR
jgi:hypothetical protein